MNLSVSLFFLLPLLAAFVRSSGSDACPDGYEPGVDAYGDLTCISTKTHIQCPLPGESRRYFDQTLDRERCCPSQDTLTFLDDKNGICCPTGTPYQHDESGGACCPVGQTYSKGKCQYPASSPPSPPRQSPPPSPPPSPSPSPAPPPPSCKPPACKSCEPYPTCGSPEYIGLFYGSCYLASFPDGKQLGRRSHDGVYVKDGSIQDITFKVCKDPMNCFSGPVEAKDRFYLQDRLGDIRDAKGAPGFSQGRRGDSLRFTTLGPEAGQFKGTASCANEECAVQIFGGAELGGFGLTDGCASDAPGVGYWDNPKVGLKMRFSPVPCDDYSIWRAAKDAVGA